MTDAHLHWCSAPAQTSWSNRVLLLSLAGIFFLTLYPFQFAHQESARFLFPFSLDGWGKATDLLDIVLNVLLFVPFGFGLAKKLRERGRSKRTAFIVVYVSGALLSYLVEFLQVYIPFRDSGWGDVITNSTGAAIGALVFESYGPAIISWWSARERALDSWLSLAKIGVLIFLYVGLWYVLAGRLQKQTNLASWTHDSFLTVGNSASLRPAQPWKGRIFELDIWDHAVAAELARKITAQSSDNDRSLGSLIAYRLSGPAPFHDDRHFLPSLDWASSAAPPAITDGAPFDGRSWLVSAGPVPALVNSVQTTGQFALRLVCQSAESGKTDARIVSLSSPSGAVNMEMSQDGSALAFWFRNPFSLRRARMTWFVPEVFATNQMQNLLLSFDGAAVSLFINGRDYGRTYELGPGVALAKYVRRVKTVELEGYRYIFYIMIFFPAGCLLGFAWRKSHVRWIVRISFLFGGLLLPAVAVEWELANAAGRAMSPHTIWFSALLAFAGSLWINADRSVSHVPRRQREVVSVR